MKNLLPNNRKLSNVLSSLSTQKGFTLVELLVVIAVLGVLAAGVLVAINPLEQLARGRDTGRKTAITEMGRGIMNYYTTQTSYPTQNTTWITTLKDSGEVKVVPVNPTYSPAYTPACGAGAALQSGYCYVASTTEASVFARAESASEKTKAGCTSTQTAWIVYSSAASKTGLTCTTNDTTYPANGLTTLN